MSAGMKAPIFVISGWDGENTEQRKGYMRALVYALADIDFAYLQSHPETPKLYASGVKYERQPIGCEWWRDIKATLDALGGDCKCLSAWRCAELRMLGVDARPVVTVKPIINKDKQKIGNMFHVVVGYYRDDKCVFREDPSKILGM